MHSTSPSLDRRHFLRVVASGAAASSLSPSLFAEDAPPLYRISLAQWSLHRTLRAGELDHLDFAKTARSFDIGAIEYVNSFFKEKATDTKYLDEMNQRAADHDVKNLLIMIDGEGALATSDDKARDQAIGNHHRWIDAAHHLGCHSIRVNAQGDGEPSEVAKRSADSLRRLIEYGEKGGINVIVENHGGISSNGKWLSGVMALVDHQNVGTLPDFGNFSLGNDAFYDRYQGVSELLPYAKAVSAKSHEFDDDGNEVHTDYRRMMRIVVDAGYHGFVGVEYEGTKHAELDGIRFTRDLLLKVREEFTREV